MNNYIKVSNLKQKQLKFYDALRRVREIMIYGYSRYAACIKLGINCNWFNSELNFRQRRILDEIYFSFSGYVRRYSINN
jgi:hypothetical protein